MTLWAILRATLFLTLSAATLAILIRSVRLRSAKIQRLGWGLVLAQGLLLAPWSIGVPWYPAPSNDVAPTIIAAEMLGDLPALGPNSLSAPEHAAGSAADRNWAWWAARGWLLGSTLVVAGLLLSYLALWSASRQTEAPPSSWQRELDVVLQQYGVRRRVTLRLHGQLGPMLCRLPGGWQIIAPAVTWAQLTRAERCAVLHHEVTHLRRRDVWKSLFARLLAALHWFNPTAWWAAARFDECAEWACDEQMSRESPSSTPVLASALLQFTAPVDRTPLVAAANGAPLCTRLRRLLEAHQPPQESIMKRLSILFLIAALAIAGAVRIRLVAQDAPPNTNGDAAFARHLATLQSQLPNAGELGELKAALATDEGQIVMRSRAEQYVWNAQERARENAIANYLESRFEKTATGYRLKPEQQAFREELLDSASQFQQDIAKISVVLKQIAMGLQGDDETTQLVSRFLSEDAGPVMLYVHELRDRLRPTMRVLEYRLRNLMVRDADGTYIVREANRDQAQQLADKMQALHHSQDVIAKEISAWADDLAEPDELHKRAKNALKSRSFAVFVAATVFESSEQKAGSPTATASKIVDNLDKATKDVAAGLVFQDAQQEEVKKLLDRYDDLQQGAQAVKPLLKELAANIKPRDELHRTWAELLQSDIGAMKLGEEIGQQSTDVREVVMDMIGEAVVDEGNGKYKIDPSHAEKLSQQIQKVLRDFRRIKRRGRELDRFAEQLNDAPLKESLQTLGGKFVVAMAAQAEVENMQVDGLNKWIAEHLVRQGSTFVIADGAKDAIVAIVREAKAVKEELKNDDF